MSNYWWYCAVSFGIVIAIFEWLKQGEEILYKCGKRVQIHLWAETHGSKLSGSHRLCLRSGLALLSFSRVYFDSFSLLLVILPLDAQNWKGHIVYLWPLNTEILSHFEILTANIVLWHPKEVIREPRRNGAEYTTAAHAIPQPTLQLRVDDQGQQWARGCQPEGSYQSQCIYHSCQAGQSVRSPWWAAFLDQRGRSTASLTPGNLKGKQQDLTLFQWSELTEYNKSNWMKPHKEEGCYWRPKTEWKSQVLGSLLQSDYESFSGI